MVGRPRRKSDLLDSIPVCREYCDWSCYLPKIPKSDGIVPRACCDNVFVFAEIACKHFLRMCWDGKSILLCLHVPDSGGAVHTS